MHPIPKQPCALLSEYEYPQRTMGMVGMDRLHGGYIPEAMEPKCLGEHSARRAWLAITTGNHYLYGTIGEPNEGGRSGKGKKG